MNRIRVDIDTPVGNIVLARPDRRNALDREAANDILEAVRALENDSNIKVIVLRSDGDDFCAGADLRALRDMLDASREVHESDARALGNVYLALHNCSKPTVAVVKGRALAGGAGLATSCDLILAHQDAVFAYPEVAIGFVPAMAMTLLVRSVGERVAFDLVATGRKVSATEALGIGLVSRCIGAAEFDIQVASAVAAIASAPSPALAETKKLLHQLRELSATEGIEKAIHINAAARSTEDFRRGVLRFTDRQK